MGLRGAFVSSFVAVVAVVACAAPPSAVSPAPPRTDLVVGQAANVPVDHGSAEAQRTAELAVTKLASRLEQIEVACRDRWLAPADVCKTSELEELAVAYRAYYPPDTDPRRTEGRIDALPRIAGPDTTLPQLVARVELACEWRCDTARRVSIEDIRSAAVDACLVKGTTACKPLAKLIPPNPLESVRSVVADCEADCKEKKRAANEEAERERRRPKTLAESHACFRKCMSGCTGGRIVPKLDGTYTRDPDDWCGTCDFTCQVSCSIPEKPIKL
jgi:hypothetical protein